MILIIDNVDSFVQNLARYVREAGMETLVVRSDVIGVKQCLALRPDGIILSPGPKAPKDAGISLALIRALPAHLPLLGVCLGHQCLVEAFGGETIRTDAPLHGEASLVRHVGDGIFAGIASPTPAGRYHSLIAKPAPDAPFVETAWTEDGILMGVAHRDRPWHGVQFHPESLLTPEGRIMIKNFLEMCEGSLKA